jgi:uncharacterized protein
MKLIGKLFQLAATDLSNHLSCEHLTQLERKVTLDEFDEPKYYDPSLEVLRQRGREHEAAYVKYLSENKKVVDLRGQAQEATLAAMKAGMDVIVQATFEEGQWHGIADILIKVEKKSKLGNWSYEAQDTKLAQNTKASTVLQLCLYTDLLGKLQGLQPEKFYVVKPGIDFPTEAYRYAEFSAYYQLVKKKLEQTMANGEQNTYPDPVEHCNICRWWQVCDKKRHEDDHLSLVAGIRSLHIVELERQNIRTLEQFATKDKLEKPERGNKETFLRKQSQAKVQLDGRNKSKLLYEILPVEVGRGFNRLPEPNEGDVYFDIEGDVYFENGGLEYVLGFAYYENGNLIYKRLWSTNRFEERKAFEQFMIFISERWRRFPKMYIYHFAPYEPTAIKRLARVHALFETEVDNLLRGERFIDLHSVFKEALLASVESYSLKELEKFTKYTRQIDLHDASVARKSVEVALELHDLKSLPSETLGIVEGYNEDDCLATEALHIWLEKLRIEFGKSGMEFLRPELKTGEATENVQQIDTRSQALFKALTEKFSEDRSLWNEEEKVKWLLAHQIEYFRREDKSAWWEFYRVHELEHEDLLDERKAISGLEFAKELPKAGREKNPTERYTYPQQEISIDEGDELIEVKGESIGTVIMISPENSIIDIRRKAKTLGRRPYAVHVSERVDPGALATSLMDLAEQVDDSDLGHSWPYRASKDLLMRRNPKLLEGKEGAFLLPGEKPVDAAVRIALNLDQSVLAIQGPPGTGKTYTGAMMIIALVKAKKKIGITAVSHKVIRNLAEATIKLAREQKIKISFVHKVSEESEQLPDEIIEVDKSYKARAALSDGKVVCGTTWLWAEDDSREVLDYLFVDEAGQMSLSHALAASRASKNLILLGDPQQLEQPQRGSHPEGSDIAALTYLLDGHPTMPDGRGLFLDITRRLHPAVCKFTSEFFYESRLISLPGLDKQIVSGNTGFDGAGLVYVPVGHRGNQNKSPEEIAAVTQIVHKLLSSGEWTNAKGETRPLTKNDILIVAPYNSQVAALIEKLPDMRIGTVDKFQGQEAPVVVYSMTASTVEDAPKGMSFLFNPNRLNVATSRAKSVCILVASPKLFEPECKTIDQMRWANAICAFNESAIKSKFTETGH